MQSKKKITKRFGILLAMMILASMLLAPLISSAQTWPEKGKIITLYLPSGAGGGADITFRALQPFLEAALGVKIVVLNKPGAGTLIGTTEYIKKGGTDGYAFLQNALPSLPATYLEPERKATYSMKDLQLIANLTMSPIAVAVKKGSRYKNLKDLVEAARANPGKIKTVSSSAMGPSGMGVFLLEKAAGVKFAHLYYDQAGEQRAAILGEHGDAEFNNIPEVRAGHIGNEIEVIAMLDDRETKFLPGVKTAEAQGYKVYSYSSSGFAYNAGTPKEIVDIMASAIKKASTNPDFLKQAEKIGLTIRVMVGTEYATFWKQVEGQVKTVIEELQKK